jgi:hypothetical protein
MVHFNNFANVILYLEKNPKCTFNFDKPLIKVLLDLLKLKLVFLLNSILLKHMSKFLLTF